MKTLKVPKAPIVIKFGSEDNLKILQQGDLYVCPLKKYVVDEKLQIGIYDKSEGVSKCETVKKINGIKFTYEETFKVNLDYPIFCLYRPLYTRIDSVYKIKYEKDVFDEYSHALVIDANKLYEKISESCGNRYTMSYHDVIYKKCSKLIRAPFCKNEEFKKQNEVRYVFLDLENYLGKDKNGVEIYGPPIIKIDGEILLHLGDLRSISKIVRKEYLNGLNFYVND